MLFFFVAPVLSLLDQTLQQPGNNRCVDYQSPTKTRPYLFWSRPAASGRFMIKDDQEEYLLYSTREKVIGLIQLPLDGNPNKYMGMIAHPGQVAAISVDYQGSST